MVTELLFRDDAYARDCEAIVVAADAGAGIMLDRTVFYPQGGGQPGDQGVLSRPDHPDLAIASTIHGADRGGIVHVPATAGELLAPGTPVRAAIDWPLRHARMRIHTALHLLSVALPFPVTGGSIGDGEGRLDFDIPEAGLDKDEIAARLQAMIDSNAIVRQRWISDEELLAAPGLVKTMAVKPPMGTGRVRLIEIEGLDLQPCGGTHVRRTGEIGAIAVTGIEKKGKHNRRVQIALA